MSTRPLEETEHKAALPAEEEAHERVSLPLGYKQLTTQTTTAPTTSSTRTSSTVAQQKRIDALCRVYDYLLHNADQLKHRPASIRRNSG